MTTAVTAAVADEPIAPPQFRTGMRMSLDDFLALGETDGCWELDNGVLSIMSSANPDHQFLQIELIWHLVSFFRQHPEPPAHLFHDMTVILSRELGLAPEPDLVIIRNEHAGIIGRSRIEGVPDLVVEILSSDRSHDLVYKRRVYAEAGVREYWVVVPQNDTVMALELRGGAYAERGILGAGDMLTTPLLPGLAIPLEDVFHHRRRPARDE